MKNEVSYGYWLPPNISADRAGVDDLIVAMHVFMALLFVGWSIFFVYCLVRFRQRPGRPAMYEAVKGTISKYLEVLVVIVEAALLLGLSMPVWAKVKNEPPDESKALIVRVVAEQFAWNIHYPGPDGVFGAARPELMSATNPLGLDPDDANGQDDVTAINTLHIPVDQPVIARLTSKDVIHSFSIPVLRVKQDVIPGMSIPVWFEATRAGVFDIACAQLCGLGHYRMRGELTVESAEEFEAWLAEQNEEFDEDEFDDEDEDA